MSPFRIVCVHSLTAHGVVGLKAFLPVLGEHCLPVPSVLLSGPGDMPECQRFNYDADGLLRATLQAARVQRRPVGLFVGYLGSANQVAAVRATIDEFRDVITTVMIDPICGDHGRAYVAAELIAAWPALLACADWMFPNATELELLAAVLGDRTADDFRRRYPRANLLVTGISADQHVETHFHARDGAKLVHRQPRIDARFNGAGDLFAARFIREHCCGNASAQKAIAAAAEFVAASMRSALTAGERDLLPARSASA